MRRPTLSTALALGGLSIFSLGTGCNGDPIPEDAFETPTFADTGGEALDLSGRFAFELVQAQYVHQPVGDPVYQTIQTVRIVDLSPSSDDGVSYDWTGVATCIIDPSPVAGADTTMDPGYYANVRGFDKVFTLSEATVGADFTLPSQTEVIGVTLSDPENEPLPTEPEDPRNVDTDGDGNPGYTVYLEGTVNADLWTINRTTYALNGTVYGPDRIGGLVSGHPEESILYSDNRLVPTDTQIDPDTEPTHNYFNLVRLSDSETCDGVKAQLDTLFD